MQSIEQFQKSLEEYAGKVPSLIPRCKNEAHTKSYLIEPYLRQLGWNSDDPDQVYLEFKADFSIKHPEKVDYALMLNGSPVIFIEAKSATISLPQHAPAQLRRYFQAEQPVYAVMTNGIIYQWYRQDPEGKPGNLSVDPFLVQDIRNKDVQKIKWLWNINPKRFEIGTLDQEIWQIGFNEHIRKWFENNQKEPQEDLIRFLLKGYNPKERISSKLIRDARFLIRKVLNKEDPSSVVEPVQEDDEIHPAPPVPPASLKIPHVPEWVPISEWKKFQYKHKSGMTHPTIEVRMPDSDGSILTGDRFSAVAKEIIEHIGRNPNRYVLTQILPIYGGNHSKKIFANTVPVGNLSKRNYYSKNLKMYFEFTQNAEGLMNSLMHFMVRYGLNPNLVTMRHISKKTGSKTTFDRPSVKTERTKEKTMNFADLGIRPGSILEFSKDGSITCKVLDHKHVEYLGEKHSISTVAMKILRERYGSTQKSANGFQYFKFENELLIKRRLLMQRASKILQNRFKSD